MIIQFVMLVYCTSLKQLSGIWVDVSTHVAVENYLSLSKLSIKLSELSETSEFYRQRTYKQGWHGG